MLKSASAGTTTCPTLHSRGTMVLSLPCAVAILCICMMSLKAVVRLLILVAARSALSVPLDSSDGAPQSTNIIYVTNVVTSELDVLETATVIVPIDSSSGPVSSTSIPPSITPSSSVAPISTSLASATSSPQAVVTEIFTVTATVTEAPSTVTLSEPAQTVTEVITVPPSSATPYTQTTWSAPGQISDLKIFNISSFAYGQTNLRVVDGIPATASASGITAAAEPEGTPTTSNIPIWDNSSSVLELLYPANSINPGTEPQGGADFYATPLDLHDAQIIALEYSVFFPVDFDWVRAGKLPGVFGGHKGCSGGDDAQTCFSTRLMWRENGAGELYLYAPKDKQTASLCSTPPLSVCNADYGLSIGRGSFSFTPGAWTHVKQTISLNTPGQQNGGFQLHVNGNQAMQLSDVYYRDDFQPASPISDPLPDLDDAPAPPLVPDTPVSPPSPSIPEDPEPEPTDSGGGLLGGLLGGLGGLLYRVTNSPANQFLRLRDEISSVYFMPGTPAEEEVQPTFPSDDQPTTITTTFTQTVTTPAESPTMIFYESYVPQYSGESYGFVHSSKPAGFIGLFFSTFFGGHDARYATPRDQYAWFKDFAMSVGDASSQTQTPSDPISALTIVPTSETLSVTISTTYSDESSLVMTPSPVGTSTV